MSDENEVEYADAEKSCYYQRIGTLRQGDYVVIRNRPCQVFHTMRYAKGKHGYRERTVYGKDLFNDDMYQLAKCDDINVKIPVVKRSSFKVVGANETFLFLVNESDKTEKHIRIPNDALGQDIRNKLDSNNRDSLLMTVTVMSAMGEDKIEAVNTE